jgi:Bacterial regulatory proteins, tetR family
VTSKLCRLPPDRFVLNTYGIVMQTACVKGTVRSFPHPPANHVMYVILGRWRSLPSSARTEEKKRQRAAAIVEAARSLALDTGVASVTLTGAANRAGVHYSAVRRYFSSHEVLLHLAAEGWTRWSNTVCAALREPGPMSPSRVAET